MALDSEAVGLIEGLGGKGATYSEIREAVSTTCGIELTRGQVAGALHRAKARGHVSRRANSRDQRPAAHAVPAEPKISSDAPEPAPIEAAFFCQPLDPPRPASRAEHHPVTLMQLTTSHCRWPLWGPGETPDVHTSLYCGDRVAKPSKPYCPRHSGSGVSGSCE